MSDIDSKVEEWLKWDQDEMTREQIQLLKNEGNTAMLNKLLMTRLEFGTAGLRGRMGPGYSQMNDLVIVQTAQGLSLYVKETFKEDAKNCGVVIGYDGRHNSKRFAELSAGIFLRLGIPVYLYSKVCPTPFVPFALTHFKCMCGIMVTASHNPKEDNGYKVYWDNGAQIISPHDKNIQNKILQNLTPWCSSWDTSILQKSSLLKDPLSVVEESYYNIIRKDAAFPDLNRNTTSLFTYTPMHGVGYLYMVNAFDAANLMPFIVVEEQKEPDPEFPTVKFPNPEEGKSALDLAMQTANEHTSCIIIANDPDADRMAVAEKQENGEWHVFTGNETGALLGWWSFFCHMHKYPNCKPSDLHMFSSTVSSKILGSMAKKEGFNFMETLTGFKWMGNKADELVKAGKTVLFAFEEAIGFMWGTAVLDKDGISAGVQMAQLAAYLKSINMNLKTKLADIYKTYGQHISSNSYYICHEPAVVKSIFERLRNFKGSEKTYPDSLKDGKYSIIGIRDLTNGYDSNQPDLKAVLPVSSSSQMLTFTFSNGVVVTLRTSGTEPKVKYYTELCGSPEEQNLKELTNTLEEIVEAVIVEFLQPEKNGLIPRGA